MLEKTKRCDSKRWSVVGGRCAVLAQSLSIEQSPEKDQKLGSNEKKKCGGTVGVGQNTNYTGYLANKGSEGSQNELYIKVETKVLKSEVRP